ncbi:hypothetical protein [Candidatus Uabimicrobium amorphum]|uniref:Uncharacterized protein n=1 Tax=Uabimicrobium amorphum TaxID=2596890 RepID=A0A5S9IKF9_UABAM|nr:hypothetical protein [Candidatus Uabimicrobium amorphum]BBM83354.1 hypothetical protein UABAM_01706 [Candidatus Uabimicrobium amorphum]
MNVEVVLDIPPDIEEGLQNKTLVRNGGVVRRLNGEIYAHLQEVDGRNLDFTRAISSFDILSNGLQAATLIYMQKKFQEIQSTLLQHTISLNALNDKMDLLIKMQYVELEKDTCVGFKYLKRAENNHKFLRKSEEHFINGLASLENFLQSQSQIELLKNYENTMRLLRCIAKNCIGEQICLVLQGKSKNHVIEDHKPIYDNIYKKMQLIDSPLTSFPDQHLIKIESYWKKTQKIKEDTCNSSNFLERHKYFDNNLRKQLEENKFTNTKEKSYLYLPVSKH